MVKTKEEKAQKVLVNCIDFNTKELVYSWLLNI